MFYVPDRAGRSYETISKPESTIDPLLNGSSLSEIRKSISERDRGIQIYELASPDGICLRYLKIPAQPKEELLPSINQEPYLYFVFNLGGPISITRRFTGKTLANIAANTCTILYIPAGCPVSLDLKANEEIEFFSSFVRPDFFVQHVPADQLVYLAFQELSDIEEAGTLFSENISVAGGMNSSLFEVLHSSLTATAKRLFLRAKTIELLALLIEQSENAIDNGTREDGPGLKKQDIEKMHLVREIIHSRFVNPPSLQDIALEVGTNENYLKRHFKAVFGLTVYSYIISVRMEKAKEMLAAGDKTIAQIARLLGYRHGTHFSTAFRKHFGYPPSNKAAE